MFTSSWPHYFNCVYTGINQLLSQTPTLIPFSILSPRLQVRVECLYVYRKQQMSHDSAVTDTSFFFLHSRAIMAASNRKTCQRKALSAFVITAIVFLIALLITVELHSSWQPVLGKVVTPYTRNRIILYKYNMQAFLYLKWTNA